jgi:hypothetical protein
MESKYIENTDLYTLPFVMQHAYSNTFNYTDFRLPLSRDGVCVRPDSHWPGRFQIVRVDGPFLTDNSVSNATSMLGT